MIANFNKNEYFNVDLSAELEDVFLTKQKLNEFRRNVYVKIIEVLTENKKVKLEKTVINFPKEQKEFNDFVEIYGDFNKFVETNKEIDEENVIYYPSVYELEDVEEFILFCKNIGKKPILNLPNFALKEDVEKLKHIVDKTKICVVVNNVWALNLAEEKILGGGMNVFNSFIANYLGLSYIIAEGGSFKMPYMTLRHCPMKQHLNADCSRCPYKDGYYYQMPNGKKLKLKRVKMSSCSFYLTD